MSVRGPERPLGVGVTAGRIRPVLEAVETLEDVPRPADRLAELAVADEVDPDLGLLGHDVRHRAAQAVRQLLLVGFADGLRLQEGDQLGWADEASDVRGQDALGAVGHRAPGGPGAVLVSMPPDRSGHPARQRRATEVTRRDVARSGGPCSGPLGR